MLQGLGNGDQRAASATFDRSASTFDGRALAVIRPTGPGTVEVIVSADGCSSVVSLIEVVGVGV